MRSRAAGLDRRDRIVAEGVVWSDSARIVKAIMAEMRGFPTIRDFP